MPKPPAPKGIHGTDRNYKDGCKCAECKWAHSLPQIKSAYGLSGDEYKAIHRFQKGLCAICNKPCSSGQRLSVDHDHDLGEVRGLLCRGCNTCLGWYEKNRVAANRYLAHDVLSEQWMTEEFMSVQKGLIGGTV